MNILEDTDMIQRLLDEANPQPAEPIDEPTCHPLDVLMVLGIEEEVFEMVDENGRPWYIY